MKNLEDAWEFEIYTEREKKGKGKVESQTASETKEKGKGRREETEDEKEGRGNRIDEWKEGGTVYCLLGGRGQHSYRDVWVSLTHTQIIG